MTAQEYAMLDMSGFPIVRLDESKVQPGAVDAMIEDFDMLLAGGTPFILMMEGVHDDDAERDHEEQKKQTRWLRKNRHRFAGTCLGILAVEPNPVKRQLRQATAGAMKLALGIPIIIAADVYDADKNAQELLLQGLNGQSPS